MILFERVRRSTDTGAPTLAPARGTLRLGSAVAGASAAMVSMLIIALPALLAWVASPQSSVGWPRAMSVGSCVWLLANGTPVTSGSATISLTPLLLCAIPLLVATTAARRILRQLDDGRPSRLSRWGGLRQDVVDVGLSFIAAYAAVGSLVALATAGAPLHVSVLRALMGTAAVAAVSVLAALGLEFRGQIRSVAPELAAALDSTVPIHLRRALRPGLWGAFAMLGAGLVLTLAMVLTHLSRIGRLYGALGADPVGAVMLSLGQLMALPNVSVWAASWMAGSGFGLGEGTAITWSHSNPGLLPLIPGLGAVPPPGPLPGGLWVSVLVPMVAGGLVGWRALRLVARLSSWRVKALTAALGCVIAALVLMLAGTLAGGSLGGARLSGLGAPPLIFGVAVVGELLLGATVVVFLSHRRASRS